MSIDSTDVERVVRDRYSKAATETARALCCAVDYDRRYLEALPPEILERDYGCGDPSRHLRPGETVLDLGSGGGKICYIAAQVVGPDGRVIGVDMNDEMLALAESHREAIGDRLGYHNVEFHKGKIQDLALNYARLDERLAGRPVRDVAQLEDLRRWIEGQRRDHPLIASEAVDTIVSNCVLNLVDPDERPRMFDEMHRVLKPGGRAVISDIVSDEQVPPALQADAELWSGCISGAYREDRFLEAFEAAGFYGTRVLDRDEKAWQVVEGIEFRSMTVEALKGKDGRADSPCCGPDRKG